MSKQKLQHVFTMAFKKGDRSLANQAMELNSALGDEGLSLEAIHQIRFEQWVRLLDVWEEKFKQAAMEGLLLDPMGDTFGSMVIAGNFYPYTAHRKKQTKDLFKNLSQRWFMLLDEFEKEEKKQFMYDIIPTPYM